jgi:hypothetical protein
VLGGLLHLRKDQVLRRAQGASFEEEKARTQAFLEKWDPYDWTKQLE